MRKLILKMSISVDGFVGGPNGEIDWLFRNMDESVTDWIVETLCQAGVHIMGSRTFYDMASYWPYSTEPFAAPMNEIPKVVFSKKRTVEPLSKAPTTRAFKDATAAEKSLAATSSQLASWNNARVASGDLTEEINLLKRESGKDILAHGGASFAQSLAKSGLVDEYQLLVHPVILGAGLPLVSAVTKPVYIKLVTTSLFKSGAVAHVYRPA